MISPFLLVCLPLLWYVWLVPVLMVFVCGRGLLAYEGEVHRRGGETIRPQDALSRRLVDSQPPSRPPQTCMYPQTHRCGLRAGLESGPTRRTMVRSNVRTKVKGTQDDTEIVKRSEAVRKRTEQERARERSGQVEREDRLISMNVYLLSLYLKSSSDRASDDISSPSSSTRGFELRRPEEKLHMLKLELRIIAVPLFPGRVDNTSHSHARDDHGYGTLGMFLLTLFLILVEERVISTVMSASGLWPPCGLWLEFMESYLVQGSEVKLLLQSRSLFTTAAPRLPWNAQRSCSEIKFYDQKIILNA
ncbi:hypothetical protein B0T17DRAFT_510495 [Bombardia bombarda]|uniref:Uncharacterized protein n=1 Tax=Bombardia bombarda TaxID=252184 RepID=A0AA39WIB4_9PEZI|nr:hypothetical protein B0T17DRAFT_510495 [Bombardia bombarda]